MTSFRAVIADDHPMCREAARMALDIVRPGAVVEAVATLAEAMRAGEGADLIVLDLGLPDSRGVEAVTDIRRNFPETPLIVVSGSEHPGIEWRVKAGHARGFVSKAAPLTELIGGIRAVIEGGRWFSPEAERDPAADDPVAARLATLSPAEARVLEAMRGGALNKQIAHELGLSEITVKQHVKAILRKLEVVNRTQAVLALHAVHGEG